MGQPNVPPVFTGATVRGVVPGSAEVDRLSVVDAVVHVLLPGQVLATMVVAAVLSRRHDGAKIVR